MPDNTKDLHSNTVTAPISKKIFDAAIKEAEERKGKPIVKAK